MSAPRLAGLAALGCIALAPLALTRCTPKNERARAASVDGGVEACSALARDITKALELRTCASDADCTTANEKCSCAQPVSRAGKTQVEALQHAFDAHGCDARLPPRTCATCPLPPAVRCAAGSCTDAL